MLHDYYRFHSMLCGLAASRRCVESFDGTILFMPATYDPASFDADDSATLLPFEVPSLTVLKYYLLVLGSLTGLCSLLGQTRTLDASEGDNLRAPSNPHALTVHPNVVACLARRSQATGGGPAGATVRLVRRFEFRFRLVGLWVAMHHYRTTADESGNERLSLVEVYTFDRKVCAAWACAIMALVLEAVRRLCTL
mmetsp:Transcript_19245/g.39247  ORF Transcript_19245/g.39247 Transcript_19245/m.39247 type:complete len:195 (-) Transcript_19245:151-735(-)